MKKFIKNRFNCGGEEKNEKFIQLSSKIFKSHHLFIKNCSKKFNIIRIKKFWILLLFVSIYSSLRQERDREQWTKNFLLILFGNKADSFEC
jgi:hypothetical protein